MGLRHTTEKGGAEFDPLEDTEECPIYLDSNDNGQVEVEECLNHGGLNLMFWTGEGGQRRLSPDQIHILKHSPIAH